LAVCNRMLPDDCGQSINKKALIYRALWTLLDNDGSVFGSYGWT
jgi:hypothetical protein